MNIVNSFLNLKRRRWFDILTDRCIYTQQCLHHRQLNYLWFTWSLYLDEVLTGTNKKTNWKNKDKIHTMPNIFLYSKTWLDLASLIIISIFKHENNIRQDTNNNHTLKSSKITGPRPVYTLFKTMIDLKQLTDKWKCIDYSLKLHHIWLETTL